PEGSLLLARLPVYDEAGALAVAEAARRDGFDTALVSAALTQSRLRARATRKFGARAARMFFTQDGLEQATRPEVAARHAARYAGAGVTELGDLCCGIGGELPAL